MNTSKLITVASQLRNALDKEGMTLLGRRTGFTKRLREVTPHRLALSLVSSFGSQRVESIADILRGFNALTGAAVQYKPFHNQLAKDEFPRFMEGVFSRVLEETVVRVLEPLPRGLLARFDDLWIQDGSSFAIHDGLREEFPGRFRTVKPAAVELHATMSVVRDQPIRVLIAPDVEGERDFLPREEELKGKLLLADRGYADIAYCERVQREGGDFVIRFKGDVNPMVATCSVKGRRRREFEGRPLQDVLAKLGRKPADLDVCWERGDRVIALRLLALWNPTTREHIFLATSLPREEFDPDTVAILYRLRWQVELLFKEWKSYANLHAFDTEKAPIAEGLIWAALTAALLKRFFAHAVDLVFSVPASTRRTAMALGFHLPQFLAAVVRGRGIVNQLRLLLDYLQRNGLRAHPRRDSERGRLRAGLRHAQLVAEHI